jgi:predicted nucleic acid-binding Zn ribbon protein
VSIPTTIQSGEAKMEIFFNETDARVRKMIKMMLFMADGAGFYVQEKRSDP